jgi:hypothetical protein
MGSAPKCTRGPCVPGANGQVFAPGERLFERGETGRCCYCTAALTLVFTSRNAASPVTFSPLPLRT